MVKTKIVCTIGPASSSETVLRKLMLAGMDIARLNYSHGTHAEHKKKIIIIRRLNKKYGRHIRILQDLEGYRIRIGEIKQPGGIPLKKNQVITLSNTSSAENVIPFDYSGSLKAIGPGCQIFIEDGTIVLDVKSVTSRFIKAQAVVPGVIKSRKGINIPGMKLKFAGLTEKDLADIDFGLENKVDYIAQSFVRNRKDMIAVRNAVKPALPLCKVIAKIENRDGINNIDEILKEADGIMIARGDMGVSIPIYEVPIVQKQIIRKCIQKNKFVITATQMLESMTERLIPTRAEATDVANAVIDGTTMVMLSGETAAGKHPVEAVKMMNQIIRYTEQHQPR
ncbi:MAG: pyruvate kinase [Elusimicrobia bacterium RIFOXYB2_FULL_48_7]|nr:MAG: pyruvate kinase [Elusimicrobia bacterium RIFOXYB2_FULL_48_7]